MSWGLEDLAMLFAPGKRFEKEERERQQFSRVQDESGAPAPTRIDLEAGVVYLRAPGKPSPRPQPGADVAPETAPDSPTQ